MKFPLYHAINVLGIRLSTLAFGFGVNSPVLTVAIHDQKRADDNACIKWRLACVAFLSRWVEYLRGQQERMEPDQRAVNNLVLDSAAAFLIQQIPFEKKIAGDRFKGLAEIGEETARKAWEKYLNEKQEGKKKNVRNRAA